jgi:hypothetical protein
LPSITSGGFVEKTDRLSGKSRASSPFAIEERRGVCPPVFGTLHKPILQGSGKLWEIEELASVLVISSINGSNG